MEKMRDFTLLTDHGFTVYHSVNTPILNNPIPGRIRLGLKEQAFFLLNTYVPPASEFRTAFLTLPASSPCIYLLMYLHSF
jgi:hypothetical protein